MAHVFENRPFREGHQNMNVGGKFELTKYSARSPAQARPDPQRTAAQGCVRTLEQNTRGVDEL